MKTAELKPAALAAHSPTPWFAHENVICAGIDKFGNNVAQCCHRENENRNANAAYIVAAVNAHASLTAERDMLRAALAESNKLAQRLAKDTLCFCQDSLTLEEASGNGDTERVQRLIGILFAHALRVQDQARAALALASTEGGQ